MIKMASIVTGLMLVFAVSGCAGGSFMAGAGGSGGGVGIGVGGGTPWGGPDVSVGGATNVGGGTIGGEVRGR